MMFLHQVGVALPSGRSHVVVAVWWDRNAPSLDKTCHDSHRLSLFRSAMFLVRFTTAVIALHGLQILLLASCYRWLCFSSWESALYFSATSYATVGYGDVTIPLRWRMLEPLESIIGVLLCGISVSLSFAIATRLVGPERRQLS